VALVVVGALLPIAMAEMGQRLYHMYVKARSPYKHATNPRLLYVGKPYASQEINALGFRDYEYTVDKPNGVFRIIVLGDSVTGGYRISFQEMYTKKLEQLLNRRPQRYEVMNFGTSQYSTVQEVALFREVGCRLSPDLVIVAYVLNDPTAAGSIHEFFQRDKAISLAWEWIMRKVEALRHVQEPFRPLEGCRYFDYYSRMHCDATKWSAVREAFQELRALSQLCSFRVLLVVFPLLENASHVSFEDYQWSFIHDRVVEEATDNEFWSLDLLPHFAHRRPEEIKISPTDQLHPNALGNEIAAAAIHRTLVDLGIAASEESVERWKSEEVDGNGPKAGLSDSKN
jgi:lysophospholipase L1-like esterase